MKLTLEDYAKYMTGQAFISSEVITRDVPTSSELTQIKKMIVDFGAEEVFRKVELFSDFKDICPDICKKIRGEEIFYSLKNGFGIDEVPAKLLYMCRKAFTESGCANAVPHMLPTGMLEKVFTVGYLRNGWTFCDVLRKFCDSKFQLLTEVGQYAETSTGADFLLTDSFTYGHLPKDYLERHNVADIKVIGGKLCDEYGHEVDLND